MKSNMIVFSNILNEIKKVDSKFPLQYLLCLSCIAINEGMSLLDLSKSTGLKKSTVSRAVRALSEKKRYGRALELIEVKKDERNNKFKRIYLTKNGRLLINRILGIVG